MGPIGCPETSVWNYHSMHYHYGRTQKEQCNIIHVSVLLNKIQWNRALTHLTQLFNHLLRLGYFPTNWKRAKVVPIPKPNKPGTDPNSYRPISLLSTLGKLFERILAVRLASFVNRQHLLPHAQFGFRKKHSTVSQLARITDYTSNGYNLHKHSDMVLLDLEKAYDTVWIHGLLYKLIVFKQPTIFFSLSKCSWKDAPLLFILMKRPRPPNYPLWPTPKSGFIDNPLCTLYFRHAAPP